MGLYNASGLVLSMKVGETIWIGETEFIIEARRGNYLKIRIKAPAEVKIVTKRYQASLTKKEPQQ